jgi:hypothetical protein
LAEIGYTMMCAHVHAAPAGRQDAFVIATQPRVDLTEMFHEAGGAGKPGLAQIPVCWGPTRPSAAGSAASSSAGPRVESAC